MLECQYFFEQMLTVVTTIQNIDAVDLYILREQIKLEWFLITWANGFLQKKF